MNTIIRFPSREEIAERALSDVMKRRGWFTASFRQLLAKRLVKALAPLSEINEPLPLHWPPELATLTDEQSGATLRFVHASVQDCAVMILEKCRQSITNAVISECATIEEARAVGIQLSEDA